MKRSAKWKKILGIIKYPLTIAILVIVLSRIELHQVSVILSELKPGFLVVLVCISLLKIFLQFTNWNIFLKLIPGVRLKFRERITSFFAGISFRIISPGGVGVYGRMLYLSAGKKDSFLAITYEKFIQTWCIIFFASIASSLYFIKLALILKIILPVVALSLPFLLLFKSPINEKYYHYFQQYRASLIPALLLQVTINLLTIVQYEVFFLNYTRFSLLSAIKSVPLVQAGNLLPVTISGLGIREYLAVSVYPSLGISKELAVSCALTIFILSNLLPALVGLFILLFKSDILESK
ncbi:MAG: flippase-like domain-containing protein [Candidatus Cloacimonetes bacterium]|nr:flippase-like domain-containing protein [Candidatus Cloacimonadota bacterium]